MQLLGAVGSLYMYLLLLLLFAGSGLALWALANYTAEKVFSKPKGRAKAPPSSTEKNGAEGQTSNKLLGGINMSNNAWIKLSVISLVGILISVAALGLLSGTNSSAGGMSLHQQHTQNQGQNHQAQALNQSAPQPYGYGPQYGMMQGSTQPMGGSMMQNDLYHMQNQLNMMQMEMSNMRQMMQMEKNSMNNMGGMSNQSGGGMMGGMMGGMGSMGGMNGMGGMSNQSGGGMGGMSMM
ncbi:MAG: hypothetical protein HPY50_18795 [Firmicutes bacterium]|nr:hypothetical protein [Bacillota bacterium]